MQHQIITADCLEWLKQQPTGAFDLVLGSPPYSGKMSRYGTNVKMTNLEWIEWMRIVTIEAVRVTKNVVVWIANGYIEDGCYHPACEGLIYELYKRGIRCERPCIWHKNAPPTKRPWFGNDWEFCMAFRPENSNCYFDWEAIATPPKFQAGGKFRQRDKTGTRREGGEYPQNKLTRPRDVFRVTVGGGHLGSSLASENEAPYPEKLVEPFVKVLCPPCGTVLDPFSGSGTTQAVCIMNGRKSISVDIRGDQADLQKRRYAEACNRLQSRAEGLVLQAAYKRLIQSFDEVYEQDS